MNDFDTVFFFLADLKVILSGELPVEMCAQPPRTFNSVLFTIFAINERTREPVAFDYNFGFLFVPECVLKFHFF